MEDLAIQPKKIDPVGLSYYGSKFENYMRVAELAPLLPSFKEYYYERMVKDPNVGLMAITRGFNEEVAYPIDQKFYPYPNQIRLWVKKWKADIVRQKLGMKEEDAIVPMKEVRQVMKTRGENNALMAPSDADLESGIRTLGGELLNDAMQMLRDDQELEEAYDEDVIVKRRAYIVNVFSHVTKLVHGKAALMLKASEEKRNTASFLMTLLSKAASGEMTQEEMDMLETAYAPANGERQ